MTPAEEAAANRAISRYLAEHPEVTSADEVAADPEFHQMLREEGVPLESPRADTTPRCDSAVMSCPMHRECHLEISVARRQIRSGEQLTINATGANGAVHWAVVGSSTLSATTGNTVTLTAGRTSETVTIEAVDGLGCRASVGIVVCNLSLTSQTVATSPANRARTRIGVGEEVEITANTACTWSVSGGGTLSPATGSSTSVRFTAADAAGTFTITATATSGACTATITFTVVAPSHWTMKRKPGTNIKHTNGRVNCGWQGLFYVHPNDVNFYRVENRELDSLSVATGSYHPSRHNEYHGHYDPPDRASDWFAMPNHTDADGTTDGSTDDIYSGYAPFSATGTAPPFNPGYYYFPITMQWRITGGSTVHNFPMVRQEHHVFAEGRCKVSKGGHFEQAMYSDPTSDFV